MFVIIKHLGVNQSFIELEVAGSISLRWFQNDIKRLNCKVGIKKHTVNISRSLAR